MRSKRARAIAQLKQVPQSCKVQTPRLLANALVRRLGDTPTSRWLEPSFGGGSLITAAIDVGVTPSRITGVDIDESSNLVAHESTIYQGVDFVEWSKESSGAYDRVVGNPPFVRLSMLPEKLRTTVKERFACSRIPVPGTSNYWLPFLLAALECLSDGGNLGFILPASWEYASYAKPLREAIGSFFREVEVHRCSRPLFPGVQDGTVVLVCLGHRVGSCTPTRYEHREPTSLLSALLQRPLGSIQVKQSRSRGPRVRRNKQETVSVKDVMSVRIGAVTGDAKYFLLTERQRLELQLPLEHLQPVLTRARQIRLSEMSKRSWASLRAAGERVWMFRPTDGTDLPFPVTEYLAKGDCDRSRYKIRSRIPWYRTELPGRAHGFMTGMSGEAPWVCLNRMRGLSATNTLYVVEFRNCSSLDHRAAWCLALLHPFTREVADEVARVYADGLKKLEPSDISNLPLVVPNRVKGSLTPYKAAVQELLNRNYRASAQIAERWLSANK